MLRSYREENRRRYFLVEATALAGLAAIAGTAAVAGGIYAGVSALSQPKAEDKTTQAPITPPPAPTPDTSLIDAQAQADARRKTILASGGQTVLTNQGMPGIGTGTSTKKSLLGS